MTILALYCIALSINLLANRGVDPDATLLVTLEQDYVLHLKIFMKYMFTTKDSTYGVELTKLPKNTQPNTTLFKN